MQTKSGTNQWHGDVYTFHQDSSLERAERILAHQARQPARPDGFHGRLSSRRDRLFAFVSADHKRFEGFQTYTRDLFLASELTQPRLTRGNDTPANRAFIESVLARFPSVRPTTRAVPAPTRRRSR